MVGYLTDRTELRSAATVAIGGWTRPMIEAELAVQLRGPLSVGDDAGEAAAVIAGVSLAIEVVDVSIPLHHTEDVLAGDIFHRHFVTGGFSARMAGGAIEGICVEAWLDDVRVA